MSDTYAIVRKGFEDENVEQRSLLIHFGNRMTLAHSSMFYTSILISPKCSFKSNRHSRSGHFYGGHEHRSNETPQIHSRYRNPLGNYRVWRAVGRSRSSTRHIVAKEFWLVLRNRQIKMTQYWGCQELLTIIWSVE